MTNLEQSQCAECREHYSRPEGHKGDVCPECLEHFDDEAEMRRVEEEEAQRSLEAEAESQIAAEVQSWMETESLAVRLGKVGVSLPDLLPQLPDVVCLCGSMRFFDEIQQAAQEETLRGRIVVMPHVISCTEEEKTKLDKLHLQKIETAQVVRIVNVGGYIGKSTMRELAYSVFLGKKVVFNDVRAGEDFMQRNTHALGQAIADFVKETLKGA